MTGGFVDPAYSSHSLGDIVPAVARALGTPLSDDQQEPGLVFPEASGYVVFLVDGLGQRLLERHAHAAPYLSETAITAGTAGVPSTTATSLTSLGTGLTPGQHGLVGYTARVPGTDKLLNHLAWDQDVDPVEWQPHPTAFAGLAARDVHVTAVNKRAFADSGLTRAGHRGADYVGADKAGERIAATVASVTHMPSLTYVYDGDLDWTGHRYGVASTAWLQQLAVVDAFAEQLRESLPSSVRLVVVADHGMVDSATSSRIDVDEYAELRDGVALLGGEARFRHLYCRAGAVDDVAATWRSVLGDRARVLTRDEAVSLGWFGPVEPQVRARLGDVMVACHDDAAVVSTSQFRHESTLVGLHGSLTDDEMSIPIIID